MSQADFTEKDVRDLISSFRDGLNLFSENSSDSQLSQIQKTNKPIEDASSELIKLTKLLFAHSTKIGIAFRPPVSTNAAYSQLKETSDLFLVLLTVISNFDKETYGTKFRTQVLLDVKGLVLRFSGLLDELEVMDFKEEGKSEENKKEKEVEEEEGVDGRLVSVGKVWDGCEKIEKLLNDGKLGFLKNTIRLSVALVEDGLKEFEEWLENPEVFDENDPFGFFDEMNDHYDSFDEGEDEEEEEEDEEESEDDDDYREGNREKVVNPELVTFGKKWVEKVKLLKLLLSSLIKSLPSDESKITGKDLDVFDKDQSDLVAKIDDLIVNFLMNESIEYLQKIIIEIEKTTDLLVTLVKSLNKGDSKKTQWLEVLQERLKQ